MNRAYVPAQEPRKLPGFLTRFALTEIAELFATLDDQFAGGGPIVLMSDLLATHCVLCMWPSIGVLVVFVLPEFGGLSLANKRLKELSGSLVRTGNLRPTRRLNCERS